MSRFSKYSLANQMLIFAQRPDATHVCGYRAWNKAGYQVRKGENGIAIYAPVRFTRARPQRRIRHARAAQPHRLPRRLRLRRHPGRPASRHGTTSAANTRRPTDPAPQRAPRTRGAQGLPRRPQRRARLPGTAARPARLHRRPPHHLRAGPGLARRIRHPRPRDHPPAAALPRRSRHAPRPHHARDRSRGRHVPALRPARARRHRCVRRVHPVLPRHARHAGRLARAHPRHRAAARQPTRRDSLHHFNTKRRPRCRLGATGLSALCSHTK